MKLGEERSLSASMNMKPLNVFSAVALRLRAVLSLSLLVSLSASAASFELKDGDRVAFLGDVLMERSQTYGHIESALTTSFPDANVTYRNLGWSGDTPTGIARAGLSLLQAGKAPADEGFKQLMKQLDLVKPTVIFFGYGMASSLDEDGSTESFEKEFRALLKAIGEAPVGKGIRYVFVSPIKHEKLGGKWPDPSRHNEHLKGYVDVLEKLAKETDSPFVNLYSELRSGEKLTQDGIHLTDKGYLETARVMVRELDLPPSPYFLSSKSVQAQALREVVLKKNELFFHRSRPQNMAYILGFRKHEQGQNAVEIPQFDPLVEKEEVKIALLRKLDANDGFLKRFDEPAPQPVPLQFASTPQEEMDFDVAEGFEITLYAENPFLAKPIQMNFDEKGRLWVASSAIYPQIKPGQTASDSIIYIEDTDADGVADQSHVFAEGLLIPTAVEPGDGGVYVGQSTELIHFKDNDGDGKADERRVVFSGFGTEDTHHTIHTLRWGMDGQLYFNQSIYIRSHLETPHGMVRLISGGIFRMDPDDLNVSVLAKGWVNTWGHQFDAYGQSFVTDGAGFSGASWGLPGSMNQAYAGARRILPTISPGRYPKFAGVEIVASEHFPKDWQGDLITCDFRAHRIVRFKIEDSGAGYVTKEMPDLVRTPNATFRPIDVKLGPDGALYIADWSNPIIQHGEVDFRDPRRDKKHGRIWRVAAKGRPLNKVPDFSKLGTRKLLNQLLSGNEFNRKKASRMLTERGVKKTQRPLDKWTGDLKSEDDKLRALLDLPCS